MPSDLDPAVRAELASRVEGADLATREGRVVAVRALLSGLVRGHLSAAEARAGAALLSVVVVDHPAPADDTGSSLLAGLLQAARQARGDHSRELPANPWGSALVLEHPQPAPESLQPLPEPRRQSGQG